MKSVQEMDIEELKKITLGQGKELSAVDHVYLTNKLMEHKVLKEEDVDMLLAMSMMM